MTINPRDFLANAGRSVEINRRIMELMVCNPVLQSVFDRLPHPRNIDFYDLLSEFVEMEMDKTENRNALAESQIFADAEGRN